jgi:hypothetical protein
MTSWVETAAYVASDPARVAVLVAMTQAEQPLDELALAQVAGLLYQRITGQPLETAVMLKHITDLAGSSLLERNSSGFRWQLTALGTLVGRQWASGAVEPPGNAPLSTAETRAWRDRLVSQLEDDASLAERAGIAVEELLAGQAARLAELRVLNRVLGDEALPGWLQEMAGRGEG